MAYKHGEEGLALPRAALSAPQPCSQGHLPAPRGLICLPTGEVPPAALIGAGTEKGRVKEVLKSAELEAQISQFCLWVQARTSVRT